MSSAIDIKKIFCPDFDHLLYDQACLIVENPLNTTLVLTHLMDACHNCALKFWANVPALSKMNLLVNIYSTLSIQYYDIASGVPSCVVSAHFQQHGVYKYMADFSCDAIEVVELPDYPYTSLLIFAVLVLLLWVIYMVLSHLSLKKRLLSIVEHRFPKKAHEGLELHELEVPRHSEADVFRRVVYNEQTDTEHVVEFVSRGVNTVGSQEGMESLQAPESKPLEFVEFEALLAFRGLVVTMWVYLRAENGTFIFLRMSPWAGLRLSDIPLGWLYWVLAASIYLHLHFSRIQGYSCKRLLLRGVLLRAVLYIAGGYFYNNINFTSPNLIDTTKANQIRVFGIFQRVGLAHLITSSVEVFFIKRQLKRGPFFQDLRDTWPKWLVMLVLVALHCCVTFLLPVPGCPMGYQGPGGEAGDSQCTGGSANYVDRLLFSRKQLMSIEDLEGSKPIYQYTVRFDPQGLLGTLTTCFLMALAMQASRIFIYFSHPLSRIIRLLCWALCQLLLGGILCNFEKYDGMIPINQYLMSLSYVLVVSGLAYLVLLGCYLCISVWNVWSGFPVIYAGVNMLVVIVGSELFKRTLPFRWHIREEDMRTHSMFLFQAFFCVCVWVYVCFHLLKHRLVCPV